MYRPASCSQQAHSSNSRSTARLPASRSAIANWRRQCRSIGPSAPAAARSASRAAWAAGVADSAPASMGASLGGHAGPPDREAQPPTGPGHPARPHRQDQARPPTAVPQPLRSLAVRPTEASQPGIRGPARNAAIPVSARVDPGFVSSLPWNEFLDRPGSSAVMAVESAPGLGRNRHSQQLCGYWKLYLRFGCAVPGRTGINGGHLGLPGTQAHHF